MANSRNHPLDDESDEIVDWAVVAVADAPAPGRLSRADLVELIEQIAALTRSGVPLPSGLRAAANELISPSLRANFRLLADQLDSGANLEDAVGSISSRFPGELRGLILAGGRSGRLADLLNEFVRSANLGVELRRMFWSTLLYPTILLLIVLVIVWFVCGVAVKSLDNIMNDFGVDKPGSTQILIALSKAIADHGAGTLLALVLVPILLLVTVGLTNGPLARRRILCGLPLIGPILRSCSLTEFCHRLAMLLEAQLPMPLAFELAGSSVGDAEVADACQRMGQAVAGGESLSSAVRLWNAIPAGLGQLFEWSENHRTLPEALHMAGDMFEARARSQSSFARSVLMTFLLFWILWWIGFALAALCLPTLTTVMRLSG